MSGEVQPTLQARIHAKKKNLSTDQVSAALMLVGVAIALLWANVGPLHAYEEFWELPIELVAGDFQLHFTLHELVNDLLMTLFFFLIGLEVKRELLLGELTDRSRAIVPIAAAVAGLVVPALLFVLIAGRTDEADAWGVVISTDTAFLLGSLAIISPRFPARLRVFLLTLAVIDDVGALLVIGVFYSSGLAVWPLVVAVLLMAALVAVRYLPAGQGAAYLVIGVALWAAVDMSGIHATLAGVAVALIIPVFAPRRAQVERTADLTRAFRESPSPGYARAVTRSLRQSLSLNERIDESWRPYVSFLVLPLFALANAGVRITGDTLAAAVASPLAWAIVVGLVLGKFIGITGITAAMVALRKGTLAPGLGLNRVAGGAALSGIGFTISLFIVPIAIEDHDTQDIARIAVLAASVIAFVLGWVFITIGDRIRPPRPVGAVLARAIDMERDHVRGPADAKYSLVEYGDFECPFCSRATGSVDAVFAHFGDDIRIAWRHLPLDGPHPHAQQAAQAVEAAARQGRFPEMYTCLFNNQDRLTREDLFDHASHLGLDMDRFAEDFDSPEVAHRIEDDRLDAEIMDISGTPTFFVNGKRHKGPFDSETLIRAIEGRPGERPSLLG